MAGRHGPALFELIRKGGSAPVRPRAEAPPARPAPMMPEVPRVEAEAPVSMPGRALFDFSRVVAIPMSAVFLIVAVMIAVIVITWASAYKIAYERGKSEAARDLSRGPESFHDIPVNNGLIPKQPETKPPEPRPIERQEKQKPAPPAPTPTGDRTPGLNYFVMASGMDKETAQRIADFLTEGGLASAIAVDRKPAAGNNQSYVVYAQKGIKPDEYKSRSAARTEVEAQAARLSKVWQKDRKGQQDFSQGYWQKYAG